MPNDLGRLTRELSTSLRKLGASGGNRPPDSTRRIIIAGAYVAFVIEMFTFIHLYRKGMGWVDERLSMGAFHNPAIFLSAPEEIHLGEPETAQGLAARLQNAFYTEVGKDSDVGTYRIAGNSMQIRPGVGSYFRRSTVWEGPAELTFRDGRISSIKSLDDGKALENYWLEPEVISTMFEGGPNNRRLLRYPDIPKVLVDAILATEDRTFFSHHGVNLSRIAGAAVVDLRADERLQGGSTLTMQLARNLFLTPQRTFRRKAEEILLAILMEQRLSKEQIFELYANQVYLGQRGSLGIYGFGDAARAYFNKEVGELTLPQAAFLAGLICGPNLYSPYKYPERAEARRNFVLRQMVAGHFITAKQAESASALGVNPTKPVVDSQPEAYFADMVRQQLRGQFSDHDLLSYGYRVYTTLDPDLERAAVEGARLGTTVVDRQVKGRRWVNKAQGAPAQPQMALVALDPHSGDIKALVGGRDYSMSQFNHAEARRQPGSAFKPFVYAAALNSGVDGSVPTITPATILRDEPTTFQTTTARGAPEEDYSPQDYGREYRGSVTVRQAITQSLNVPTVGLAQTVGYDKVRNLAVDAGFNTKIQPTPSIALGSYVATPVEVAGGYTVFANDGQYVPPRCIVEVEDADGQTLWSNPVTQRRVLDPRVNYLMVNLLEGVINYGTGAGARSRGFSQPAAGKTGTSHDGWFAGFTSNLLAVVWVGYDDDRDINLTGSQSAVPLWAEFMKRASDLPSYHNARKFVPPPGIVTATIGYRDNPDDPDDPPVPRNEFFIDGTQPRNQPPPPPIPAEPRQDSNNKTSINQNGGMGGNPSPGPPPF